MKAVIAVIIEIDGAIVMPEMKPIKVKEDGKLINGYKIGDMNHDYKFGAFMGNGYWASKDKKEWVLAIAYEIECAQINPTELFRGFEV